MSNLSYKDPSEDEPQGVDFESRAYQKGPVKASHQPLHPPKSLWTDANQLEVMKVGANVKPSIELLDI